MAWPHLLRLNSKGGVKMDVQQEILNADENMFSPEQLRFIKKSFGSIENMNKLIGVAVTMFPSLKKTLRKSLSREAVIRDMISKAIKEYGQNTTQR